MFRVSVDVGGTFTDLVALDEDSGELRNFKVPSVPKTPEQGVVDAFNQFLVTNNAESILMIGHATTIATNALFGQLDLELPLMGLITTRGFRDVIEIGRQRRAEVYNLFFQRPFPLVERRFRYEVEERIDAKGNILSPLDPEEIKRVLRDVEDNGIESLAICFLNSYVNSEHEKKVLELARQHLDVFITASSLISNEYREFERFSTAVVNAALMPIINTYITQLEVDLRELGVTTPLYVMQSNGGIASDEVVVEKPATIVESGPASGVVAAAWLGNRVGEKDIISFDMGGTTAKAGTIRGKIPEVIHEYEVAGSIHMGRHVKGSGYPVLFPFIDLAECSAGGGTIAWVDEGGVLNVGPMSAGACPGPACYGQGGIDPTITDANLILGRLNPRRLLGGEMEIYPSKAKKALKRISGILGRDQFEVSISIVRIANSIMSKILRIVSVERGFDPRLFSIVAFGGAGPMHSCPVAKELEIHKIIIPLNPGMFSAMGLLVADFFHDYNRSFVSLTEDICPETVESCFLEMEVKGRETLRREGITFNRIRFLRHMDLRYYGQAYELSLNTSQPFDSEALNSTLSAFHIKHREIYGYSAEKEPVEVVNLRLKAIGTIQKPRLPVHASSLDEEPLIESRKVYFENVDSWMDTPVLKRKALRYGDRIRGPAIIEQYDSTTVIYPDWTASQDKFGNLLLRRNKG